MNQGSSDILTQLNHAMAYIEAHIDDDLALNDVSTVTTYSPYHFGRLFYYVADMPLVEYIRKRKLSLAAMALQTSDIKIIDLAVMYGYDNADSFSRAFTKQHGVTPSAARKKGVALTIYLPLTFQIKIKGVQAMNWRIEEKEEFEVFGIERLFSNDETDRVPSFWDEVQNDGRCDRLVNDTGNNIGETERLPIGAVCGYFTPDDKNSFPYMICAMRKPNSDIKGYTLATIPKTTWAVFRSEVIDEMGTAISDLFTRAFSEWLPSSGYEQTGGPDMEVYYTTPEGKYFEEVWIPVAKG